MTPTGNKYHKKDCIFIKGKTNSRRMTKEEFESKDDVLNWYSKKKKCFLKFGYETIDDVLDVEGTSSLLKKLGFDNNPLRQVREKSDGENAAGDDYDPHKYGAHLCDFCGAELLGGEYELLKDGRERCNRCSMTAIKKVEDFRTLYKTVLRNMEAFYGIKLNVGVKVRTTDAKHIAKHVGTEFVATPGFDGRVLGFAEKDKTGYSIYIENGSPKLAATATIAHELTHIWQYTNCNEAELIKKYGKQNMLEVYEGMAFTFIMQNIAANLGGMLTPFGNPQNLYLYTKYKIPNLEFMKIMAPPFILSVAVITACCIIFVKPEPLSLPEEQISFDPKKAIIYLILFALAIAIVFRGIPYWIGLIIIPGVLLFVDRKALRMVDYGLLLTFVLFFIFAGNMARIDAVRTVFSTLLEKSTLLFSVISCQFISNVPSAILLSQFTSNYQDLLVGVNIGGVGTLIASLASLITFREYVRHNPGKTCYYIGKFSLFNFSFLVVLTGFSIILKYL